MIIAKIKQLVSFNLYVPRPESSILFSKKKLKLIQEYNSFNIYYLGYTICVFVILSSMLFMKWMPKLISCIDWRKEGNILESGIVYETIIALDLEIFVIIESLLKLGFMKIGLLIKRKNAHVGIHIYAIGVITNMIISMTFHFNLFIFLLELGYLGIIFFKSAFHCHIKHLMIMLLFILFLCCPFIKKSELWQFSNEITSIPEFVEFYSFEFGEKEKMFVYLLIFLITLLRCIKQETISTQQIIAVIMKNCKQERNEHHFYFQVTNAALTNYQSQIDYLKRLLDLIPTASLHKTQQINDQIKRSTKLTNLEDDFKFRNNSQIQNKSLLKGCGSIRRNLAFEMEMEKIEEIDENNKSNNIDHYSKPPQFTHPKNTQIFSMGEEFPQNLELLFPNIEALNESLTDLVFIIDQCKYRLGRLAHDHTNLSVMIGLFLQKINPFLQLKKGYSIDDSKRGKIREVESNDGYHYRLYQKTSERINGSILSSMTRNFIEPVRIPLLLSSILQELNPFIQESGIKLKIRIDSAFPIYVNTSLHKLRTTIYNIVYNAIDNCLEDQEMAEINIYISWNPIIDTAQYERQIEEGFSINNEFWKVIGEKDQYNIQKNTVISNLSGTVLSTSEKVNPSFLENMSSPKRIQGYQIKTHEHSSIFQSINNRVLIRSNKKSHSIDLRRKKMKIHKNRLHQRTNSNAMGFDEKDDYVQAKSPVLLINHHNSHLESFGILKIEIIDNGNGISKHHIEQAFSPFNTSFNSDKLGVGMYNSYNTIKSIEGEIQITSRKYLGTDVIMQIPAVPTTSEKFMQDLWEKAILIGMRVIVVDSIEKNISEFMNPDYISLANLLELAGIKSTYVSLSQTGDKKDLTAIFDHSSTEGSFLSLHAIFILASHSNFLQPQNKKVFENHFSQGRNMKKYYNPFDSTSYKEVGQKDEPRWIDLDKENDEIQERDQDLVGNVTQFIRDWRALEKDNSHPPIPIVLITNPENKRLMERVTLLQSIIDDEKMYQSSSCLSPKIKEIFPDPDPLLNENQSINFPINYQLYGKERFHGRFERLTESELAIYQPIDLETIKDLLHIIHQENRKKMDYLQSNEVFKSPFGQMQFSANNNFVWEESYFLYSNMIKGRMFIIGNEVETRGLSLLVIQIPKFSNTKITVVRNISEAINLALEDQSHTSFVIISLKNEIKSFSASLTLKEKASELLVGTKKSLALILRIEDQRFLENSELEKMGKEIKIPISFLKTPISLNELASSLYDAFKLEKLDCSLN